MGLASFEIDAKPGASTVTVNGETVNATRVVVDVVPAQIPQVTVFQAGETTISGVGVVTVVSEPSDGEAIVAWLAEINPEALEQECQARVRAGRRDPYRVALEVLREYAQ